MTLGDEIPAVYLWWIECQDDNGRPVGAVVTRTCCGAKAVAVALRIAWPEGKGQMVKVDATPLPPVLLLPADMMGRLLDQLECSAARRLLECQLDGPKTDLN